MTLRNIDSNKFRYLIAQGFDVSELSSFFRDNRAALILAGAKVQNLPRRHTDRVRIVANDFSEKAYTVFGRWANSTLMADEPIPTDQLLDEFRLMEQGKLGEDKERTQLICRGAIRELLNDSPSAELLALLQEKTSRGNGKSRHSEEEESLPSPSSAALISPLVRLLFNDELQPNSQLSSDENEFLDALRKIKSAKPSEVDGLPSSNLGSNPALASALQLARSLKREITENDDDSTSSSKERENDISYARDEIDLERISVFAKCISSSVDHDTVFLEPVGAFSDGKYVEFRQNDLPHIFPTTGDLIGFQNTHGLKLPHSGEFGLWRVEEFSTERPIRCRLRSTAGPVFEVHRIPFASAQYDDVRAAIKTMRATSVNRPIFALSDGLVVRLKRESTEVSDESFDEPLDAWRALSTVKVGPRTFFVGPLPTPDCAYDCADVGRVLKNIIKAQQQVEAIPRLTKMQTTELIASLKSSLLDFDLPRMNQIVAHLDDVLKVEATAKAAFEYLSRHPAIAEQVEEAKRLAEQTILEQKASLVAELESLRRQRSEIEQALKVRREEQKKLPPQVSKAVRAAFQDARDRGIDSLADASVLGMVLESLREPQRPMTHSGGAFDHKATSAMRLPAKPLDMEHFLGLCGVNKQRARAFVLAFNVASHAGMGVLLRGSFSGLVATKYAMTISRSFALLVDVPVGLNSNDTVAPALATDADVDTLVLRNYNHSAIEVYGSSLLVRMSESIVDPSCDRINVIATFSDSIAGLPRPSLLEKMSLFIDLERTDYVDESFDVFKDRVQELCIQGPPAARPWSISVKRLNEALETLNDRERESVVPIVAAGIASIRTANEFPD